jgi:hypothetical protein
MGFEKMLDPIPVKWRVQSFSKFRAQAACVPYIDARDVMKRLDDVCGPGGWQDDFKEVNGLTIAGIGVKCGDSWIWKWDVGTETKIEKEKGLISDSFKRAGVKWGIGRHLYAMDVVYLPASAKKAGKGDKEERGKVEKYPHVVDGSKKRIYDLSAFINESLAGKETDEDKKMSSYWETIADQCQNSRELIRFWHENQGSIGQWLDDKEERKLKAYLAQIKKVFYSKEEIICPTDETGETKVFRSHCVDDCDSREGCPAWE